jgi:hypothetical protein
MAMSLHIIEGSWEEIERHKSELIGRHLRVMISSNKPNSHKPKTPVAKILRARGAFKGMFGGTKAILDEKQAQIELEERNF